MKLLRLFLCSSILVFGLTSAQSSLVTRGTGDWLYFYEEWISQPENEEISLASVVKIVNEFKRKNIPVVVSITPAKSRIYARYLQPNDLPKQAIRIKYAKIINGLKRAGVPVVDLSTFFLNQSRYKETNFTLYFRQDSHWSRKGGFFAGQYVGKYLLQYYGSIINNTIENKFVMIEKANMTRLGDLVQFIPETERNNFQPELIEDFEVTAETEASSTSLLTADKPEIFLAGTSYATPFFGFWDGLRVMLSRDVINYAQNANGQWETINKITEDALINNFNPKIIVWEIPERFFFNKPSVELLEKILSNIQKLPKSSESLANK
jgi:hypothetical protein